MLGIFILFTLGLGLFFSSEKVQTKVASQLTKRINKAYTTNISVRKAKISLQGEIDLQHILVLDHRQDSLLYVDRLSMRLDELEGVLKGNYHLTKLAIDRPQVSLKTYASDSLSNWQKFFEKFKRNNRQKKMLAGIEKLVISNGLLYIENEKTASVNSVKAFALEASQFNLSVDELKAIIDNSSFLPSKGPKLTAFNGELKVSKDALELNKFYVQSEQSFFRGDLSLVTPDFSMETLQRSAEIELNLYESEWSSNLLPAALKINGDNQFKLSGSINGSLPGLMVVFDLQSKKQSRIQGEVIVEYHDQMHYLTELKQLKATVYKEDLKTYLKNNPKISDPLEQLNWNRVSLEGEAAYSKGEYINSTLILQLNQGSLGLNLSAKKASDSWVLENDFNFFDFGKGHLIDRNNELFVNGNLKLLGELSTGGSYFFTGSGDLISLEWNDRQLQNLRLKGTVSDVARNLEVDIFDSRVPLELRFTQNLIPEQTPFLLSGSLKGLDLSAFELTPPNEKVKLHSDFDLVGDKELLKTINLNNIQIVNRAGEHSFTDISIQLTDNNGFKSIKRRKQSDFPFVIKGNFRFSTLGLLAENALREALLLPQRKKIDRKENIIFDFTLNKELVKALYPGVNTPNNIRFNGEFSSDPGVSKFKFELPYIGYNNYRFEGLSLTSAFNTNDEITHFKANSVVGKVFQLSDVELVTKNENDRLRGILEGQFGISGKNHVLLNFLYEQKPEAAFFTIDDITVDLGSNLWTLHKRTPVIEYNTELQRIAIKQFKLSTSDQIFGLDGYYQSTDNYAIEINSQSLNLSEVLPVGDKFNFAGRLDAQINFTENSTRQLRVADLFIDDLVINNTPMGAFNFTMGGSSQLKTYPLALQLLQENVKLLEGTGTLFMAGKKPNLSLDVEFDQLSLGFLSALGKDKITDVKGTLSGPLNLWGEFDDLKLRGDALLDEVEFFIPSTNVRYAFENGTSVAFRNRSIDFPSAIIYDKSTNTSGLLSGQLRHFNFNAWELDVRAESDRLMVYDRPEDPDALFYGKGFLDGVARFNGPTKQLSLTVDGSTAEGTSLVIPWQEDKGLSDTSYIDYINKNKDQQEEVTAKITSEDEAFRGFEMLFNLDVDRNAAVEIVVDQSSGSTLSGRGAGNILIETNIDGKFNIWGDFIAYDGIYNFKNLGLIDKKFNVKQGGTIVWEGDPLEAQLNIEATYQVPGGANPALLVDNPNFNRKIPTNVDIQLVGNLLQPDDPVFDISFPNTTGIVVSEINYRLADQQRRQLQAISLLSQGIFISDVSVSLQGITNNLYEKASDVFSTLIGANDGKMSVGLNYLQGEENPNFDIRTEDRIGLTLSTQISDRILINGKIGVPIDGVQETVIVGDVQIDFILNESGSLKAKVFNRENDFRYLGDEFGYTQGMGMSYQVDFNTFQELLQKIKSNASKSTKKNNELASTEAIDFRQKKN